MIISVENPKRERKEEEIKKIKKIFSMLRDVKLPNHYKFTTDCVQIRYVSFFYNFKVGEVNLSEDKKDKDILEVRFDGEKGYRILKRCFEESKIKFKLIVKDDDDGYYY